MHSKKTLLATAMAVLSAASICTAGAAPLDHRGNPGWAARHEVIHHGMRRPIVVHERVLETLRFRHSRGLGDPHFIHGRYVVRSHDRFGRIVLVEINAYTGAFIREVRI